MRGATKVSGGATLETQRELMDDLHTPQRHTFSLNEKIAALYTQRQGFQEPWLLALRRGVKLCDGCDIPSSGIMDHEAMDYE
jgi:hypothetical protein